MTSVSDVRSPELGSEIDERPTLAVGHDTDLDLDAAPCRSRAESRRRLLGVAVAMVVSLGFVLRLYGAMHLSPHVDEPSSILAAHAVAERGVPILPSGTAYFQGATLSYLLSLFVWLDFGELANLVAMRLVIVVSGTIAIYLCYRLGHYVTGNAWVGAAMAALVAIDPVSVQWSSHVRMYALLQAITVGLAWAFIHLLITEHTGQSKRASAAVIGLFWLAVFTHVGATLLFAAMTLSALAVCRRSLFQQRGLLGVLALCGMAPLALLTLNRALGTASVGVQESSEESPISFVGDNLIAPFARFRMSPGDWEWEAFIRAANLFWLIPGIVVALCTLVGLRGYLGGKLPTKPAQTRAGFIVLLSFYWLPALVVGAFTVSPKPRYLLHVHVLGYLFVAAILFELVRTRRHSDGGWRHAAGRVAVCAVVVAVLVGIGGSLSWRLQNVVVHPDYHSAMAYTAVHHMPGQPLIVALPPVAYLALSESERDDLYFLAGSQDRPRAERYTRWANDGRLIDYWVGVSSIVTANELRGILQENPQSLLVIDEDRLIADWAYGGEIEDVIREMTSVLYRGPGGVLVLKPGNGSHTAKVDRFSDVTGEGAQAPLDVGRNQRRLLKLTPR